MHMELLKTMWWWVVFIRKSLFEILTSLTIIMQIKKSRTPRFSLIRLWLFSLYFPWRRGDRRDPRAAQSRDSRAAEKLYSSEMNRLISVRRGDGKFYRKIFGLKYDYFYYYHCVYSGVVTVGGVRWWRSNVLIRQRKLSSCDSPRPGNHIWPYQGCLSALLGGRGREGEIHGNIFCLATENISQYLLEHDITKRLTTEQNVWLRLIYVSAMTGGLTELYFPMFPSRHRPRLLLGRPVMLQ